MNRKAPAFQFYADDFVAGTHWMTAGQCGAYIRLLCHQWSSGPIVWDIERLSRIAGVTTSEFSAMWSTLGEKFEEDAEGRIFNARLEEVRAEKEAFSDKQRKAAIAGWDKRRKRQADARSMPTHMPDGCQTDAKVAEAGDMPNGCSPPPPPTPTPTPAPNKEPPISSNEDIAPQGAMSKRKKFKKPTKEEVAEYCLERGNRVDALAFWDFYQAKNWMVGKNKMADWKAAVRTWERNRGNGEPEKLDAIERLRRMGQ